MHAARTRTRRHEGDVPALARSQELRWHAPLAISLAFLNQLVVVEVNIIGDCHLEVLTGAPPAY
jgi:hypothetical protein